MSLTSPLALALLLLAWPIIVAFRRPPPPVARLVGSLFLLRHLPAGLRAAPPARVRDRLSLALFLLSLGLVVAALSFGPARSAGGQLLLLDTSASMGAGGRWTAAQAAARALIAAHPADPISVLTTAPATLRLRDSHDPQALTDLLDEARPSGEDGPVAATLLALCAAEPPPHLTAATDSPLPEGLRCPTSRVSLGYSAPNAGITALVGRASDQLGSIELAVDLRSTDPGEERLRVSAGEAVLIDEVLPIDGELQRLYTVTTAATDLDVRLGVADELPADDRATLHLAAGRAAEVVLVTGSPTGFLAAALGAHPRVHLRPLAPGEPLPAEAPDLVVLEALPAGTIPQAQRVAVFGLDPRVIGLNGARRLGDVELQGSADADPSLRFVELEGIRAGGAWVIDPPAGSAPLLTTHAGALALRLPGDRGTWWGLDLRQSDLGLRAGFVHLIANLVEEAVPLPPSARGEGLLSAAQTLSRPPTEGSALPPPLRLGRPLLALGFGLMLLEGGLGLARRRSP